MRKNKVTWTKETWWQRTVRLFKRDWQLHLCIWLPMIYVFIFRYVPIYGIQIAFRNYNPGKGIWGSDWVGFQWFIEFMNNQKFGQYLGNTIILSLYTLVVGFPLPIIYALLLNTVTREKFKKTVQTISYMPHFISTVIFVGILNMVFSPVSGIYGNIYRLLGGNGFPADFRATAESFRHLYVWSGVWQSAGYSSIIYVAALAGVSQDLQEAAMIDGASRLQRIINVDIPSILPTIVIQLIFNCASVVSIGMDKVFLMQNDLNAGVSEVISTFVYKVGVVNSNFGYSTAAGLFQSVVAFTLLVIVNKTTKKLTETSLF